MAFFARPQSRSAAVKIVAPPAADGPATASASNLSAANGNGALGGSLGTSSSASRSSTTDKKDSTQRQCRNILIHGYCKFKDKGCQYYHPPDQSDVFVPSSLADSSTNIQSSNSSAALAEAVNAPVFIPRSTQSPSPDVFPATGILASSTPVPADFTLSDEPNAIPDEHQTQYDLYSYHPEGDMPSFAGQMESIENGMYNMDLTNSYYQPQSSYIRQPLNYHLYTEPIPPLPHPAANNFISDDIREELLKRSETVHTAPAPGLNLPEELQGYHTLVPLEPRNPNESLRANLASWVSTVYRATNSQDGRCYALRRVENFRLLNEAAFKAIDTWTRIRHPNVVSVLEAFTTRAFVDSSLVVVYDYHPNARSLFELYFRHGGASSTAFTHAAHHHNQRSNSNGNNPSRIPENLLWSYVTQIACGIKAVHDAGAAVRTVDVSKVLVTGRDRVRISSCGVLDVLFYDTPQELLYMQQQDIVLIARLILSLCCGSVHVMGNVHKSMEVVNKYYSPEVKSFVMMLLPKHTPVPNIQQVLNTLSTKLHAEVDSLQMTVDRLEGDLMSELENGRLVRLLCKFGFINERPEFDRDQRWSETGDRYIIKLFRDYVFHQVDENGNPVVNLSHVLACLNKLDVGTDERIMLVSRDEQSCLVVSYREVKSCIDAAFGDLARGSH